MFQLDKSPSYFWPVKVNRAADGGKFETHTFDVKFESMSASKNRDLFSQENAQDNTVCKMLVKDWKGIQENGQDVPFSEHAFDKLLEVPNVAAAIVRAYVESLSGAKTKN